MKIYEDYLMYFTSKKKRLLYNRWLRPITSAEFRKGGDLMHRLITERQVVLWLLDASCCNTPTRDDQEWIVTRIGSLVKGEGVRLRKIALVKSGDVFFGVIAEWMKEKLHNRHGDRLSMRYFDSLADAHNWLLEVDTSKATAIPTAVA